MIVFDNNAESLVTGKKIIKNETASEYPEQADNRRELRGDHLTWGATPLKFNAEQIQVYNSLYQRIQDSATESTPDQVKEFVLQHFMSRFFQRQDRNTKSFVDRRSVVIENLDDEYQSILAEAIDGVSNPNDLLKLRHELDMPSIELGRLTHPYGKNMETLPDMRQAVDYAIEQQGGVLIDDDSLTTYDVDGAHIQDKGPTLQCGFLMKRKRVRGLLPDGTVVMERSTFVLRVDIDSPLDQNIASKFREIRTYKNPFWDKMAMEIINANNLLPALLDEDKFDIAIPLSTTVYAFNPERIEEVENNEKERRLKVNSPEERKTKLMSELVERTIKSGYNAES